MKRLYIRAGKSPFEVVTVSRTAERNLIASNSGNVLFAHSVYRMLSAPGVKITPNRYRHSHLTPEELNEKYDAFVIPLANAFRPIYQTSLERMTALVEKLTIPVIVVGVGAQTDTNYSLENLSSLDPYVKRFVGAVLDRSHSIGVRGECTQAYLNKLGFSAVEVIGCPSLFLHGPSLKIRQTELHDESKIGISISSERRQAAFTEGLPLMGRIATRHFHAYKNSYYLPQESRTMNLLLGIPTKSRSSEHDTLTRKIFNSLIAKNRIRFFIDASRWEEFTASCDFVFGSRLHGTIGGLLGGTPSYLLAHDSRTLEIAQYFDMPYKILKDADAEIDARELHESADFSKFENGQQGRFWRFAKFLENNGLDHIYNYPDEVRRFDEKLSEIEFPATLDATKLRALVNKRARETRAAAIRAAAAKSRLEAARIARRRPTAIARRIVKRLFPNSKLPHVLAQNFRRCLSGLRHYRDVISQKFHTSSDLQNRD